MNEFQKVIRKALIRDFFKDILAKPNSKENKDYAKILKPIVK